MYVFRWNLAISSKYIFKKWQRFGKLSEKTLQNKFQNIQLQLQNAKLT